MTVRSASRGLGVVGVVLCLTAGCAAPPEPPARVATFASTAFLEEPPSRIVMAPFAGAGCSDATRLMVTRTVALALQEALHRDVIISPGCDERLAAESALWRRGRVNVDALVEARKNYMADAFLFGAITHYKEYDPPILGLKLSLLSARSGEVLWAAEGLLDGREADVRRRAEAYFEESGLRHRLYGSGLVFMSPRLYARFVADEITAPLRRRLERRDEDEPEGK